ncbi:MAG: 4Fe-4S dicluster domain-containing protein [Bacteroidales bacterium]|nr:4Fe-4S dicluster domain-containing protein [Bacteroidales bacterium]MCF8334154.1 4Fe-4S dicluster domain-containing protein [Bacteroidales bacterium]
MHWIQIVSAILAGVSFLILLTGAIYSLREKEKRAAGLFFGAMIVIPVLLLIPLVIGSEVIFIVWGGLEALLVLGVLSFVLPYPRGKRMTWDKPVKQIDERTIMFSRNLLKEGTEAYATYYRLYPQHLEPDSHFRKFPGLMSSEARYFNPATFYAAEATFNVIEHLRDMAKGKPLNKKTAVSAPELTRFLNQWSQKLGAVSFGVTRLQEYHKCPSNAISFDDPNEIEGITRWQINQEACFTLWKKIGTDCGRCVSVCPYSHPDNLLHNLVRKGLRQSAAFRKAALKMDDFLYGRKPAPKKEEEWMRVR